MAKPKNIIIFGETGVGKSSLVNMLTGRAAAQTGDDVLGVTFDWEKHSALILGSEYQVYDTIGLNEGDKGTVKASDAIVRLFRLVKSLEDGVSLLIFCMRGRLKKTTHENYKLFYQIFCDSKVPIILMVTGLEELEEEELDTWWNRNQAAFETYGMTFNEQVCGTTTKGKKGIYTDEYNITSRKLRSLIPLLALETPWQKPRVTWFGGIIRVLVKSFPRLLGNISWAFRTLYTALRSVAELSDEEARELASEAL